MSRDPVGLWSTLRPWLLPLRGRLLVAGLCAALVGVAVAAQPLLVRWIIDDGLLRPVVGDVATIHAERLQATLGWTALFLVVSLFRISLWSAGYRRLITAVEDLQRRLRSDLFRHQQRLCLRYHDRTASGETFNAIMGSPVATVKQFCTEWALTIPYQVVAGVVAVTALAFADPGLTVLSVVLALGVAWSTRGSQRAVRSRAQAYLAEESKVSRHIADLLHGLRETKLHAREAEAERAIERSLGDLHAQSRDLALEQHRYHVRPEAVRYIATAVLYAVGGWRCVHGDLGVGAFVAFIMVFDTLMQPLLTALRLGLLMAQARSAAERIAAIFAVRSSTHDDPAPLPWRPPTAAEPAIVFRGVTFGYAPDRRVLDSFDLTVPTGCSIALVGASGSGKSTLVALMLRLYDVDGGQVLISGHDVRRYALSDLRSAFAVVPQQPFIFARSIRENLVIAAPDADDATLWQALTDARLDDVVRALPRGLDSELGEGGCTWSGGQRQRLAIARALLTRAPFLILDEATAALDNHSERAVQAALATAMRGRTTIIIAHRLSTVRQADAIVVLAGGQVVQQGSYDALATAAGPFRDLLAAGERVSAA